MANTLDLANEWVKIQGIKISYDKHFQILIIDDLPIPLSSFLRQLGVERKDLQKIVREL